VAPGVAPGRPTAPGARMTVAQGPHVPVDRRWLGMDRRTLAPALVALAVLVLWAWLLPWVAGRVAWADVTGAGEQFQVSDGVTMTAAPGWTVLGGLRTTDATRSGERAADQTVLSREGVVLQIQQGPFDGDPQQLLQQAELITGAQAGSDGLHLNGTVTDVRTTSGLTGVQQPFSSVRHLGSISAFVVEGTGLEVQVSGPHAQVLSLQQQLDAMISSLAEAPTQGQAP
jgi:hypothetical protein